MVELKTTFLFDCDGTLFDTEGLKAESWGRGMLNLVKSKGSPLTAGLGEEDFVRQVASMYRAGPERHEVAHHILRQCTTTLAGALAGIVDSISADELMNARESAKNTILDENSPSLIQSVWKLVLKVRQSKREVGLVTTAQGSAVRRYFALTEVTDESGTRVEDPGAFFDVMVCGKKKEKAVKEAVCRFLGKIAPHEAVEESTIDGLHNGLSKEELDRFVLVEDSADGTQDGRAAGVRVIAVPNEYTESCFPHLILTQPEVAQLSVEDLLYKLDNRSRMA